ncbi:MAG: hypothetical protein KAV00_02945 [Phycisphaerae bacterium]|nr:hypothetical protein [Phycisphaerae bacterium]
MNKWIGTVVTAALGVLLLWVGIRGLFGEFESILPAGALGLICAIAALLAGEWLCWGASTGHTHPPAQAGRIAGTVGVVIMGALLLTAGILSIHAYGIS